MQQVEMSVIGAPKVLLQEQIADGTFTNVYRAPFQNFRSYYRTAMDGDS